MKTLVFGILLALAFCSCEQMTVEEKVQRPIIDFRTNQQYIEGLYQEGVNFDDAKDVFYHLLASMEESVIVYPSEHYFYYKTNYHGKPISGTILLKETFIDSSKVTFGYVEKYPRDLSIHAYGSSIGGSGTYTEEDSVYVKRQNDSLCTISFRDVSVDFHFYMPGMNPPKQVKFLPSEEFLCNGMDESGLKHGLVYNKTTNSMYWILNEDEKVPETFDKYTPEILVGKRTEFVYYNDSTMNRKILIGVSVLNVLNNNWFDGPFDQVPDVYIKQGKLDMKKYIDKVYGFREDRIGKYLNYIGETGRVAVNNYTCYDDLREMYTIVQTASNIAGDDRNAFYRYITTTHYEVPERYINPRHYRH